MPQIETPNSPEWSPYDWYGCTECGRVFRVYKDECLFGSVLCPECGGMSEFYDFDPGEDDVCSEFDVYQEAP